MSGNGRSASWICCEERPSKASTILKWSVMVVGGRGGDIVQDTRVACVDRSHAKWKCGAYKTISINLKETRAADPRVASQDSFGIGCWVSCQDSFHWSLRHHLKVRGSFVMFVAALLRGFTCRSDLARVVIHTSPAWIKVWVRRVMSKRDCLG